MRTHENLCMKGWRISEWPSMPFIPTMKNKMHQISFLFKFQARYISLSRLCTTEPFDWQVKEIRINKQKTKQKYYTIGESSFTFISSTLTVQRTNIICKYQIMLTLVTIIYTESEGNNEALVLFCSPKHMK